MRNQKNVKLLNDTCNCIVVVNIKKSQGLTCRINLEPVGYHRVIILWMSPKNLQRTPTQEKFLHQDETGIFDMVNRLRNIQTRY